MLGLRIGDKLQFVVRIEVLVTSNDVSINVPILAFRSKSVDQRVFIKAERLHNTKYNLHTSPAATRVFWTWVMRQKLYVNIDELLDELTVNILSTEAHGRWLIGVSLKVQP